MAFVSTNLLAEDDKKAWVLDLKTSTLIPNYIGKVKMVRGKAMAGESELGKGDKVYPKGVIKTSDKSLVVVELIDESVLTLGPNSEFTMENWAFRTKNDREGIYSLIKGKMRAEIKVKTKEDDQLKIKSPLVAMGIRGTEVLLNHSEVNGKMVSQVALIEGKVTLLNKGTEKKIDMVKNDYVEVNEAHDVPELDKKLNEEEIKKYNAIISPEEKNLMDYPVAMNTVKTSGSSNESVGSESEETAKAETEVIQSKNSSSSWKENLKKLNDSRPKPH